MLQNVYLLTSGSVDKIIKISAYGHCQLSICQHGLVYFCNVIWNINTFVVQLNNFKVALLQENLNSLVVKTT